MSKPMQPSDPAWWMMTDGVTSSTTVYNKDCYICRDPDYSQMGLPLCYPCIICGAHVPADDTLCDNGHEQPIDPVSDLECRKKYNLEITKELEEEVQTILENQRPNQ